MCLILVQTMPCFQVTEDRNRRASLPKLLLTDRTKQHGFKASPGVFLNRCLAKASVIIIEAVVKMKKWEPTPKMTQQIWNVERVSVL